MNPTVRWPDKSLPVEIDCAPGVLTELEIVATDGLLAMPRIGLGIGGLLRGKRTRAGVEILRSIPIACSHARGPSFVLTEEEIAAATQLVAPEDLKDEEVVGWYCSKTREPMTLTEHDRVLFDGICPEPWQVMLLIRPVKGRVTTAAFGLRGVHLESICLLGEWLDLAWQELAEYQVPSAEPEPEPAPVPQPPATIEEPLEVGPPSLTCRTLFGVPLDRPEPEPEIETSRWPFRLLITVILLAILAAAAFFTRSYWLFAG